MTIVLKACTCMWFYWCPWSYFTRGYRHDYIFLSDFLLDFLEGDLTGELTGVVAGGLTGGLTGELTGALTGGVTGALADLTFFIGDIFFFTMLLLDLSVHRDVCH